MSQNVATQQQNQGRAPTPLDQAKQQILSPGFADQVRMALPEHISIDKFQRTVITAVAKDPDLLSAERSSLFTACVEAAADGLLPNGKEAALVVYNTKNRSTNRWEKKVQYIPMIGGIYKKARNSGEIAYLAAHLVHERDDFDYELGFEPVLRHKPSLGERGAVIGVYAAVTMKDGTKDLEFMTCAEVEEVRKASKASGNGPWVNWWGEMARKTAVRRLAKRVPMSADLERVVQRMDAMYEFEDRKKLDNGSGQSINLAKGDYSTTQGQLSAFAADPPAAIEQQHETLEFIDANGESRDLAPAPWVAAFTTGMQNAASRDALNGMWEINSGMLPHLRAMGHEQDAHALHDLYGKRYDALTEEQRQPAAEPATSQEPPEPAAAETQGDMLGGQAAPTKTKAGKKKGIPIVTQGGTEHAATVGEYVSRLSAEMKEAAAVGQAGRCWAANKATFEQVQQRASTDDDALLDALHQEVDEHLATEG